MGLVFEDSSKANPTSRTSLSNRWSRCGANFSSIRCGSGIIHHLFQLENGALVSGKEARDGLVAVCRKEDWAQHVSHLRGGLLKGNLTLFKNMGTNQLKMGA